MLGHKTQKVEAARSAASTFWVLVCFNTSGDSDKPQKAEAHAQHAPQLFGVLS